MMTQDEARRIALDAAFDHTTVTYDLAAYHLKNEPALCQLCEIKAALRRMICEPRTTDPNVLRAEFYMQHWRSALSIGNRTPFGEVE